MNDTLWKVGTRSDGTQFVIPNQDQTAYPRLLEILKHPPEQQSAEPAKRRPCGHIWLATEFHDAVTAHGRPFGVFDPDRQLPYRG